MMPSSLSIAAAWFLSTLAVAWGQDAVEKKSDKLKIGDPAPKLQVAKWVQGDVVKEFEKDKAYIVEFWATWCGPCVATIPHVNELQQKYADQGLVVIGQNCWEEDEATVPDFVKKMGEKMTYRVALDDKSADERGAMATNWMMAAGRSGIPCAFVVDKSGKIAWIGHPAQLKEEILDAVLAGTFDVTKAAEIEAAAMKAEREAAALRAKEMEAQSEKQMAVIHLQTGLGKAMRARDWPAAEKFLTDLEEISPDDERKFLAFPRFQILLGQKKTEDACNLAGRLSDENPKSPKLHNDLAWALASAPDTDKPNLDLAEKLARHAVEIAPEKGQPMTRDTLARILFLQGRKDDAIKTQEEAVAAASPDTKPEYEKTLQSYREGTLPPVAN